jgi:hypothetical protein
MRREALSGAEVKGVVDLWLGCGDRADSSSTFRRIRAGR